jgi:hypothetical protein
MKLGDRSSLPQYLHTSFSVFALPPDRSLPNERLAGWAAAFRLVTSAGFFTVELRLVPSVPVDPLIFVALLSRIGSCGHLLCSAEEASRTAVECQILRFFLCERKTAQFLQIQSVVAALARRAQISAAGISS